MTMAVVAMSLFAIAFFGASLLFPHYFQPCAARRARRRRAAGAAGSAR